MASGMSTGIATHAWLPGPLMVEEMPLSVEEVEQLYASNLALTREDAEELSLALPYLGDVLDPEQFRAFARRKMETKRTPANGEEAASAADGSSERAGSSERTVAAVADLCGSSSAKVVTSLRTAVFALAPESYEAAYRRLAELSGKRGAFRMRAALMARLAPAAPNWAAAVAARWGVHGGGNVPGDVVAAWEWRRSQQG